MYNSYAPLLSLHTQYGSGDCVVRLRGLPWAATSKDVLELLKDCQVMNGEKGIHFTFAPDGRPSGEAFVELCNEEDVSNALNHNNEHMGRRYVEIFRARGLCANFVLQATNAQGLGTRLISTCMPAFSSQAVSCGKHACRWPYPLNWCVVL